MVKNLSCVIVLAWAACQPVFADSLGLDSIVSQYKDDGLVKSLSLYEKFSKAQILRKDNSYGTNIVDYLIRDSDIVGKTQLNYYGGVRLVYRVSYHTFEGKPFRSINSYAVSCADGTQIEWIKSFDLTGATSKFIFDKQSTEDGEAENIWKLACAGV